MNYAELATAALERRKALVDEFRTADGQRQGVLSREIEAAEVEARRYIELDESRTRALRTPDEGDARSLRGTDTSEWRSLLPSGSEVRAAAVTADMASVIPTGVATKWVDHLRGQSAFLNPAAKVNVIPFSTDVFKIPVLASSQKPTFAAEAQALPEIGVTAAALTFDSIKYGGVKFYSTEILADSAFNLREAIAQTFIRDMSLSIDNDAWNGSGTNALKGLLAAGQSTKTTLTAGNTSVKWSDVLTAYGNIQATGGTPTVIWASPDMATALRSERENGSNGGYLAGSVTSSPTVTGAGLPLLVAPNLPAKTVLIADGTRVYVGMRTDTSVKVDESAGFANDTVGFRVTQRVAGISVAEATSVQWIQAAAA